MLNRNHVIAAVAMVYGLVMLSLLWLVGQSKDAAVNALFFSMSLILLLGGVALLAVLFFGLQRLFLPLGQILDLMRQHASDSGDLSARLPEEGDAEVAQLAKAYNASTDKVQRTLRDVQREMEGLALGLSELTAVTAQMGKDTRTQSDHAASSAATVEQITVSINHIADHARDMDHVVEQTQRLSSDSADSVLRVSEEVGKVSEAVVALTQTMDGLGASSQEISGIVGVIKDIADQTNLLALNAAIEAARAGDMGRGFAVVADEVRKLAERTSNATVEIAHKIESVGRETQSAVGNMALTANRVAHSVTMAEDARGHMLGIREHMGSVVTAVRQIAESTQEQSSATHTLASSAERLDVMTQATDSALQQASNTLKHLDERAKRLLKSVGQFKLADIEVFHSWAASSEARAVSEIKALLNQQGHHWADVAGDHSAAMIRSRITIGNPPTAAAIGGVKIQNWAKDGGLADLNAVATQQDWRRILPAVLDKMMQANGQYVAVPLGVARVNVMWMNASVLKRAGAQPPKTWDEFFVLAEKLRQLGTPMLAVGEQAWQIATLFEAITCGLGGASFYHSAFCQLDSAALTGPVMIRCLEALRKLKPYCTPDAAGREWNLATADVINGRAAMQLMGDWAKGEFAQAGKVQGIDYLCLPAPTQNGEYSFAADTLLMFKQNDPRLAAAQQDFVSLLMSSEGQEVFNLYKGNIPARIDVNMSRFDDYAKQSAREFASAASKQVLLPSWAHNMAVQDSVRGALFDAVDAFWKNSNMSPQDAARRLHDATRRTA
ncbi:extracellular solute-binding protein [Deefgea piscis]|uniref:Extracellular solute-binding protein n=1 Tax=Deefgea piscis TaxID=2739061 RepID=A0A6M8SPP8_9NEIS|nr:extracellular solute-binding protein [Deefgea piscis]QKJ67232.1 extracellular solute-binding protein [Deefgea piscis]